MCALSCVYWSELTAGFAKASYVHVELLNVYSLFVFAAGCKFLFLVP